MAPQVFFITGTSTGFGYYYVEKCLKEGDKVVATARAQSFEAIKDLKSLGADILELEVTAHIDTLRKIAAEATAIYGHVDVVMSSAGEY